MPLIGMPGSAIMLSPLIDALRTAVDIGFDAFEIYGDFPQCNCDEISEEHKKEIRAIAKASGITLSIHAPFTSLNIAALNKGIRAESIRQTIAAIDFCADIGGKTVVVHNGKNILSERFREKSPMAFEAQWNLNIDSLCQAARQTDKRGIELCLENIGFETNCIDRCIDDMQRIRAEVNSQSLYFCLDIGHARLAGELVSAIEKMGPFIRQIHFTDNFGQNDDHLEIGKGNFDYTPHLDFFRKFDGILTIEVINISTDAEPVRRSKDYVKKILCTE